MLHINLKHHLARLTLSVLLAAINTCSVFASGGTIRGHGTEYDPYIIADAIDWEVLAHYISIGHTSYIGYKFYKLADNYNNSTPVSTMLGDDNMPFLGVFDGNFKVFSVNIVDKTTAEGTAPFRKIQGATIKNFIVSGMDER